jgi:hypothetical protein
MLQVKRNILVQTVPFNEAIKTEERKEGKGEKSRKGRQVREEGF